MTLPEVSGSSLPGPLAAAMVTLAGTPDHSPAVETWLMSIARLATDRVAAARYASITALRGRAYITVAVSHDLIRAVDEAQYADNAGPCLQALDTGSPVGVPDIDKMIQWPSFHEVAPRMGLRASVSVPLFAGRGEAIAALNVYGTDLSTMAPLIAGIAAAHGHPSAQSRRGREGDGLEPGGRDLVVGYAEALGVRADVRLALKLLMTENNCGNNDAYLSLCIQAAEAGTDLAGAAATVIKRSA